MSEIEVSATHRKTVCEEEINLVVKCFLRYDVVSTIGYIQNLHPFQNHLATLVYIESPSHLSHRKHTMTPSLLEKHADNA